jgi:hypothetical protein
MARHAGESKLAVRAQNSVESLDEIGKELAERKKALQK